MEGLIVCCLSVCCRYCCCFLSLWFIVVVVAGAGAAVNNWTTKSRESRKEQLKMTFGGIHKVHTQIGVGVARV